MPIISLLYSSAISTFFLPLTHLPFLPANYPSSPLSFGITNDDSRTNKIPTAHFSLFTFLLYPSHYKPRVFWHTLQHIKETGPNLSASPASSTFLLSAANNTTYAVIYHTFYSILILGTFSFPFFSLPSPDRFKVCIGLATPFHPNQTPSETPPALSSLFLQWTPKTLKFFIFNTIFSFKSNWILS